MQWKYLEKFTVCVWYLAIWTVKLHTYLKRILRTYIMSTTPLRPEWFTPIVNVCRIKSKTEKKCWKRQKNDREVPRVGHEHMLGFTSGSHLIDQVQAEEREEKNDLIVIETTTFSCYLQKSRVTKSSNDWTLGDATQASGHFGKNTANLDLLWPTWEVRLYLVYHDLEGFLLIQ